MKPTQIQTVTLAITGASGAQYGLRLLQLLIKADLQVYVLISTPGQIVVNMETELKLPGKTQEIQASLQALTQAREGQLQVFGKDQWTAPVASGSAVPDAMVICPCSMGTLASVAQGLSNNLIERAADVILKEKRSLIVVPRETPFSTIHLQNMLRLSQAGAVILPPNPGFYESPKTVEDLVDFVVARILDHLGVEQSLMKPWGKDR